MPRKKLALLSIDGGGVRGLSALVILKRLMETIDRENPPKPCEYFDMIGGSSTGGYVSQLPDCRTYMADLIQLDGNYAWTSSNEH